MGVPFPMPAHKYSYPLDVVMGVSPAGPRIGAYQGPRRMISHDSAYGLPGTLLLGRWMNKVALPLGYLLPECLLGPTRGPFSDKLHLLPLNRVDLFFHHLVCLFERIEWVFERAFNLCMYPMARRKIYYMQILMPGSLVTDLFSITGKGFADKLEAVLRKQDYGKVTQPCRHISIVKKVDVKRVTNCRYRITFFGMSESNNAFLLEMKTRWFAQHAPHIHDKAFPHYGAQDTYESTYESTYEGGNDLGAHYPKILRHHDEREVGVCDSSEVVVVSAFVSSPEGLTRDSRGSGVSGVGASRASRRRPCSSRSWF